MAAGVTDEGPTSPNDEEPSSCPSWARTRTLLIQRALQPPQLQQLASIHAGSCYPMLEFDGLDAGLCRVFLTQMIAFCLLSAGSCGAAAAFASRVGPSPRSNFSVPAAAHSYQIVSAQSPQLDLLVSPANGGPQAERNDHREEPDEQQRIIHVVRL